MFYLRQGVEKGTLHISVIFVSKENVLPSNPTQHHMIDSTEYARSWFSGPGDNSAGISIYAVTQA